MPVAVRGFQNRVGAGIYLLADQELAGAEHSDPAAEANGSVAVSRVDGVCNAQAHHHDELGWQDYPESPLATCQQGGNACFSLTTATCYCSCNQQEPQAVLVML